MIPSGPGGPYCTSSVYDTTGTGAFGGRATCGAVPLNYDRSIQRNEGYTGEVILTSQFDGKFNFLAGGIYNRFKTSENSYYVNAFGLDYAAAVIGLAGTLGQQFGGNTDFPTATARRHITVTTPPTTAKVVRHVRRGISSSDGQAQADGWCPL